MKKLSLIVLILCFAYSCKTKESAQSDFREKIVIQKETDTLVFSKPDSASIRALIKCDSAGNAYIAEILTLRLGKSTRPVIKIVNSVLEAECIVDSMEVYLQLKSRHETIVEKKETVVTVYKEKKLKFLDRLLNGIIAALTFIVIFSVIILIFRLWISRHSRT